MGTNVWLASATGLIGVALGGLVSLAVSRQQIREAREQRASEALQERYRRSAERRFKAYSDFITHHRAFQNALHFYYSDGPNKLDASDIDSLLRTAYDSVAMVFLVVETNRTYDACRGVLRALDWARDIVYQDNSNPDRSSWQNLNVELGRTMREFQNAARTELEVSGPEWPWIERARPDSESPGAEVL